MITNLSKTDICFRVNFIFNSVAPKHTLNKYTIPFLTSLNDDFMFDTLCYKDHTDPLPDPWVVRYKN